MKLSPSKPSQLFFLLPALALAVFALSVPVLSAFLPSGDRAPISGLPINHVQLIGSHNSYKQAIDPTLFNMIKQSDSAAARSLEYSHIPLSDQLSLGLRNLEIDVYADEKGGKYAHPHGLDWEGAANQVTPYDPQGLMKEPGFKVLHVQDIDFRSNCLTFKSCLQELKGWSDAHPDHYPVFITMNAKDDTIHRPGFTEPEKFTTEVFDHLDKAILDYLGKDKVITPDDIRGNYSTLESAVLAGNWPTMTAAKGKFIFILDEGGEKRDAYISGHPSLRNRVFFADAPAGTPEAAIMIINDAIKDSVKIRQMVQKGYIVRTRADADTEEARQNDKTRFKAACASGAQIVTTDYYKKSAFFPSDYVIHFDDGGYLRENPFY